MPKSKFWNLSEEKRTRMLDAALEEFAKGPYQDISINRIIQAMEISTGSFYLYFEDKKDLYFHLLSQHIESMLEESLRRNVKMDILNPDKNSAGSNQTFTETSSRLSPARLQFYSNFNLAPAPLKREWTYERMLNTDFMRLYDFSFFDSEELDPAIREHKQLMMALVMTMPTTLQLFHNRQKDPVAYHKLYQMCLQVLIAGFKNYAEPVSADV